MSLLSSNAKLPRWPVCVNVRSWTVAALLGVRRVETLAVTHSADRAQAPTQEHSQAEQRGQANHHSPFKFGVVHAANSVSSSVSPGRIPQNLSTSSAVRMSPR